MGQASTLEHAVLGSSPESLNFRRIIYNKEKYIATVTINRPDVLNCFDYTTLKELGNAFIDASVDDSIAVIVISGAGERAFCTGADLKEQEEHIAKKPNDYYKWMYAFIEMHDRLRNIGKPTIARLNGMVVGGGNELNMACDLAIAADHVTIRQVGAARGSVAAGGATQWLPLIVGDRRAREILFLCEPIDAYTALDWGLVNQVVPSSMLDSAVLTLAEKLYNKLPECTRYTKQQLNFWRDFSWGMTIGHARDWLTVHAGAHEVNEGLQSFRKKADMPYEKIRARAARPLQSGSSSSAQSGQSRQSGSHAQSGQSASPDSPAQPGQSASPDSPTQSGQSSPSPAQSGLPVPQFGAVELAPCHACNAPMPADFAFCGRCGQKRGGEK